MIYEYECDQNGHLTELIRVVSERHDPVTCWCGEPARLVVSQPLRGIVYANDRNGGQDGGSVQFTGPRQRQEWLKAHGKTEVGSEPVENIHKAQRGLKDEKTKKRKAKNKAIGIDMAKAMGASGDSIQKAFDGSGKWES